MSEEVTRRCDFKIQEKRKYVDCGVRIPDDLPTVFALGEDVYDADLCSKHRLALQEALAPFIAISSQAGSTPVSKAIKKALLALSGAPTQTDMRIWAQNNGYDVAPTGSLKKEIVQAYNEAHA
jgi:hypothetical protein